MKTVTKQRRPPPSCHGDLGEIELQCGLDGVQSFIKKMRIMLSKLSKQIRKRLRRWRGTTAMVISWILIYIIIQTCKLLTPGDYRICLAKINRSTIHLRYRPHNWQVLRERRREVFLYSAHYRPLGETTYVHILALGTGIPSGLQCLLWYPDSVFPIMVKAETLNDDIDVVRKGTIVEHFYFSCMSNSTLIPTHVSLVMPRCAMPGTLLEVHNPQRTTTWQHEFAICMASPVSNIHLYRIIEWVEAHKMFGVSEISLYYHTFSSNMSKIMNHYQKDGVIKLHYMPLPRRFGIWSDFNLMASLALNDCMWRNMFRYRYIFVLVDFNEIVVPRIHSNYSEMLHYVDKMEGISTSATSYTFQNVIFQVSCGAERRDPLFSYFLRYLKREMPSEELRDFRSIVDPRHCLSLFMHYCNSFVSDERMPWTVKVRQYIALTHHYRLLTRNKTCDTIKGNLSIDSSVDRFRSVLSWRCQKKIGQIER